jgi:protein required for attachment to host cells
MTALNFPNQTLVVVATGAEAKTFRVVDGSLRHDADWKPENLGDEGPSGKRRLDMTPTGKDEAVFSKQIAERLYALAHQGAFDHLVIVADPQTLGEVRPLLHLEVTDKVVLELAKTLINSPVADIERSLRAG